MLRYIIVSVAGGILFAAMDGLIHSNSLAQRLYEAYKPIAKTSVNAMAGVGIDLLYGFAIAAIFLLPYPSLPGPAGWAKGVSFGLLVWFFRVLMGVAGEWMTRNLPAETLIYTLVAGLAEMLF